MTTNYTNSNKIISVSLSVIFLFQIFFPTISWAITSQNENNYSGFQNFDNSNLVSPVTGDFNYNIPIASIPEFPLTLGYSSGAIMSQEATEFGLGFSSFSGAIVRNTVGLPDDILNAERVYEFSNEKYWDASIAGSFGVSYYSSAFGSDVLDGTYGVSASIISTFGYSNYSGVYASLGLGISADAAIAYFKERKNGRTYGAKMEGGASGSVTIDSREEKPRYSTSGSATVSPVGSAKFFKALTWFDKRTRGVYSRFLDVSYAVNSFGKTNFSNTFSNSNSFLPSTATVSTGSSGIGGSLSIPIGGASVTGKYYESKSGNKTLTKKLKGNKYLSTYDRANRDQLADFTIQNEDSWDQSKAAEPNFLQKDFFSVNTLGLSGSMQLYQEKDGVFSRNYNRSQERMVGITGLNTVRKEVYPWVAVEKHSVDKGIDILKMLKRKTLPEENDFDNLLFKTHVAHPLNDPSTVFGDPVMRMRGDYAGENNLSSSGFDDYQPNKYDLIYIHPGKERILKLNSYEKKIPQYYPKKKHADQPNVEDIKRSTIINTKTIGDIKAMYDGLTASEKASTQNSFYTFDKAPQNNSSNKQDKINITASSNLNTSNILEVLEQLPDNGNQEYINDLIGAIEIEAVTGLKYYFNIPVFQNSSESISLSGDGPIAPTLENNDYRSIVKNGTKKDRNKSKITDQFKYPIAWLLSGIVGEDYVDIDGIAGPSDGDVGYWVKFKYIKTADNYTWRSPFTGLNHQFGSTHIYEDDFYSATSGSREIYQLLEVESSNHVSRYNYSKRYDAWSAKSGLVNGVAENKFGQEFNYSTSQDLTGTTFQYLVSSIDLYNKHPYTDHSKVVEDIKGVKVRSSKFYYDYSQCKGIPNNLASYMNISTEGMEYYYDDNSAQTISNGKLTLRKVQDIVYDENGNMVTLPSTEFSYWGDNTSSNGYDFNPDYDPYSVDMWGNYSSNSKSSGVKNSGLKFYNNYCEVSKQEADLNSKVFNISEIFLPSGGVKKIDYQAKGYNSVAGDQPYLMRKVVNISESGSNALITLDISDLNEISNGNSIDGNGLKIGDVIYGEIAFYQAPDFDGFDDEKNIFLSTTEAKVVNIYPPNAAGSEQVIEVSAQYSPHNKPPFISGAELYAYTESPFSRALKESFGDMTAMVSRYKNLDNDGVIEAIKKMVANVRSVFRKSSNFKSSYHQTFGDPTSSIFSPLSFIRTHTNTGKYTGSSVLEITDEDNFMYATTGENSFGQSNSSYGQVYEFIKNDNSNSASGVATREPITGVLTPANSVSKNGFGFAPSPSLLYSSATIKTKYKNDIESVAIGESISRYKGKMVYNFITPDHNDFKYQNNFFTDYTEDPGGVKGNFKLWFVYIFLRFKYRIFGKTRTFRSPPIPFPAFVYWQRKHKYISKSYSYRDITDMYGRPEAIYSYDGYDQLKSYTKYNYFKPDEEVTVYGENFIKRDDIKKPGKIDQTWSEQYYTKESDIQLIPIPATLFATTKRSFYNIDVKESYIPPLLKSVESMENGFVSSVEYTKFDYLTADPVEMTFTDADGDVKITRNTPAYWVYPELGPKDDDIDNTNQLVEQYGSVTYLNSVADENVLNSNISTYTEVNDGTLNEEEKWSIEPEYFPLININGGNMNYEYVKRSSSDLENLYTSAQSQLNGKFIKSNVQLWRPYQIFSFSSNVTEDGVLENYIPYSPSTYNANWVRQNQVQSYNSSGGVVNVTDVLGKPLSYEYDIHMNYKTKESINSFSYETAFSSAESKSIDDFGNSILDIGKYQQGSAIISLNSDLASYDERVLNENSFMNGFHELNVQTGNANTNNSNVFGEVNIQFVNGVSRNYSIYLDESGAFQLVSEFGEPFKGFFVYPDANNVDFKLVFDQNVISTITVNTAGYPNANNIFTVEQINSSGLDCGLEKNYRIPTVDNISEVHTGDHAFMLKSLGQGTEFRLLKSEVGEESFSKRYLAKVWVLKNSVSNDLVIELNGTSPQIINGVETAQSGNWKLLQAECQLDTDNHDEMLVYMKSNSSSGIVVYDDILIEPFDAVSNMKIYDTKYQRIHATISNNHFKQEYDYDNLYRIIEKRIEVEGQHVFTIQKNLYNNQKND